MVQARVERSAAPRVAVLVRTLDRAALAALAYALTMSFDVRALHVDTGGIETMRVRARWRSTRDGVALEILRDEDALRRALDDPRLVVIVPTVRPRLPFLYPIAYLSTLLEARRLRRCARAVITLPYAA